MYAELMQKTCSCCKVQKSVKDFYKRTSSPDGLAYLCKPCDTQKHREFNDNNRELVFKRRKKFRDENKARLSVKKNRAKCSPEYFHKLFEEQNGSCAICGLHQNKMRRRIAIDHAHDTKEIRGLLCDNCNRSLGLLKDSIEVLQNAISYLMKYKKLG